MNFYLKISLNLITNTLKSFLHRPRFREILRFRNKMFTTHDVILIVIFNWHGFSIMKKNFRDNVQ